MIRMPISAAALGLFLLCGLGAQAQAADTANEAAHVAAKHKVVVQVSDSDASKWQLALNNVHNMQKALGKENIEIEVVAYGPGIGMLKLDSKVAARIQEAVESGVKFGACQNTMRGHHLTPDDMLSGIGYVPSGVIEVMKKQEEGYSYIRP